MYSCKLSDCVSDLKLSTHNSRLQETSKPFLACQGFASNVSFHNILYLGTFSCFWFLQGLTDDLETPPCMMVLICVMSCHFFISLDNWPFKASSILVMLISTICHVWLNKKLVVLHIIWWLYLWQHLQFSWRFQFSSLIMSDLMKNWWFFQSFSVFTLELIFNSHGDFSFHHLPWLSWWRIVGSLWLHNWPLTVYNSSLTFFEPLMLSDKIDKIDLSFCTLYYSIVKS